MTVLSIMATPAPASSESSGPSASSTSSSSSSSNSGEGSGKKSMFDETPEEAKEKKEALRKLASGDAAAAKKVHPTELPKSFIDAVEKDDSKDPGHVHRAHTQSAHSQHTHTQCIWPGSSRPCHHRHLLCSKPSMDCTRPSMPLSAPRSPVSLDALCCCVAR